MFSLNEAHKERELRVSNNNGNVKDFDFHHTHFFQSSRPTLSAIVLYESLLSEM